MTRWLVTLILLLLCSVQNLAQGTQMTILWDPSPDAASVAGYTVHVGTSLNTLIPIDVGNVTSWSMLVIPGQQYVVQVSAYNAARVSGPSSSPVFRFAEPQLPSSPDQTVIFRGDGKTLIDCEGATWGFNADGGVTRNSIQIDGGDDRIALYDCRVYFFNPTFPDEHGSWWQYVAGSVSRFDGDPRPVITPSLKSCMYAAPATPTKIESRPIGQMMQGFNPIGASGVVNNQADRIRILKSWGWEVDFAQFVEGNLRADKIDRLFLIVRCVGLPQ